MNSVLYYIHDPMCSWCWAFKPTYNKLQQTLPAAIQSKTLLGGLAEDTDLPMPDDMKKYLQQTWQSIQQRVSGTQFNYDFWTDSTPIRSTYPACRAVIAARQQGDQFEAIMINAIQQAYYLQARNPSENNVLIELAIEAGLDKDVFVHDLQAQSTHQQLMAEIAHSREYRVDSFPSLILDLDGSIWRIPVNYNQSAPMTDMINQLIDSHDA